MSLTGLIDSNQGLRDIIKNSFTRPSVDQANILVETEGQVSSSLVGTALDYLFRLKLAAIHDYAVEREWVIMDCVRLHIFEPKDMDFAKNLFDKTRRLKGELGATGVLKNELIACCLSMAHFDNLYRSGHGFDSLQARPREEDIKAIKIMFEATDWRMFESSKGVCILNPLFGASGSHVGGADADWIIDDRLDDLKAGKKLPKTIALRDFAQLIGYYTLDRLNQEREGLPPRINELSIYYARFGVQCKFKVADIISEEGLEKFMTYFADLIGFGRYQARRFEIKEGGESMEDTKKEDAGANEGATVKNEGRKMYHPVDDFIFLMDRQDERSKYITEEYGLAVGLMDDVTYINCTEYEILRILAIKCLFLVYKEDTGDFKLDLPGLLENAPRSAIQLVCSMEDEVLRAFDEEDQTPEFCSIVLECAIEHEKGNPGYEIGHIKNKDLRMFFAKKYGLSHDPVFI